jgi:hypothetical protein
MSSRRSPRFLGLCRAETKTNGNARVVVDAIFWGYLRALNPAIAQTYSRLEAKIERLTSASLAERERADARVSFDETLLRLPPVLRELPASLRTSLRSTARS